MCSVLDVILGNIYINTFNFLLAAYLSSAPCGNISFTFSDSEEAEFEAMDQGLRMEGVFWQVCSSL